MLSSMRWTRKRPILVTALVVMTSSYFLILGFLDSPSSDFFSLSLSSSLAASGLAGSAGLSSAKMVLAGSSRQVNKTIPRNRPWRCCIGVNPKSLNFGAIAGGGRAVVVQVPRGPQHAASDEIEVTRIGNGF